MSEELKTTAEDLDRLLLGEFVEAIDDYVIPQPVLERANHDLALLHANHARWVADSAWRARNEPLVREWFERRREWLNALEEDEDAAEDKYIDKSTALAAALDAEESGL